MDLKKNARQKLGKQEKMQNSTTIRLKKQEDNLANEFCIGNSKSCPLRKQAIAL